MCRNVATVAAGGVSAISMCRIETTFRRMRNLQTPRFSSVPTFRRMKTPCLGEREDWQPDKPAAAE